MVLQRHKCKLCAQAFYGFGHNAWPLVKGRCCEVCNELLVIPRRLDDFSKWYAEQDA